MKKNLLSFIAVFISTTLCAAVASSESVNNSNWQFILVLSTGVSLMVIGVKYFFEIYKEIHEIDFRDINF